MRAVEAGHARPLLQARRAGAHRHRPGSRRAQLEWWSADGRGEYHDELRATQRTGADGAFRYETVSPGRYPGRPPHLHVKISAPGHRTLVTQVYPGDGQRALATDFVLVGE
ncbi:MAG: hypothetical protein DMD84_11325 [Candidatus Rokuibacteriota bacterium]|nr:MAG: hypothetical protein DMD84_11325 [Candidatus Rokubacteria bacterium]